MGDATLLFDRVDTFLTGQTGEVTLPSFRTGKMGEANLHFELGGQAR